MIEELVETSNVKGIGGKRKLKKNKIHTVLQFQNGILLLKKTRTSLKVKLSRSI